VHPSYGAIAVTGRGNCVLGNAEHVLECGSMKYVVKTDTADFIMKIRKWSGSNIVYGLEGRSLIFVAVDPHFWYARTALASINGDNTQPALPYDNSTTCSLQYHPSIRQHTVCTVVKPFDNIQSALSCNHSTTHSLQCRSPIRQHTVCNVVQPFDNTQSAVIQPFDNTQPALPCNQSTTYNLCHGSVTRQTNKQTHKFERMFTPMLLSRSCLAILKQNDMFACSVTQHTMCAMRLQDNAEESLGKFPSDGGRGGSWDLCSM
jgi:hypothetical protein